MIYNFKGYSKKITVVMVGIAMIATLTSCSKGKNSAEPSESASVSASASASVSASASAKPSKKPTAKPKPEATTDEPVKVDPTVKKPTTVTVAPKPPIKLDSKEKVFEKELTRLTKLDPKTWDKNVDEIGPIDFASIRYPELLKYAKGALCSYIATGLDDLSLGTYMGSAVTYDSDLQLAIIKATRKAYKCKG
jgi:hypothetical protein